MNCLLFPFMKRDNQDDVFRKLVDPSRRKDFFLFDKIEARYKLILNYYFGTKERRPFFWFFSVKARNTL